jgi:hypothetical protein
MFKNKHDIITKSILERIDAISSISQDVGQVLFASVCIQPLLADNPRWDVIAFGFAMALAFWFIRVISVKI